MKQVAAMLKAIHSHENREAAKEKAVAVAAKLREMKLKEAAKQLAGWQLATKWKIKFAKNY